MQQYFEGPEGSYCTCTTAEFPAGQKAVGAQRTYTCTTNQHSELARPSARREAPKNL